MSLKNKIKNLELTRGSWITIGNTVVAEVMSNAGFDWLTIDMEHSSITLNECLHLIQTISLSDVSPLVRVSENEPSIIKRVMDVGAHGVIVPMVNNKEDALKAVQAIKYPPLGKRGVGLFRGQKYGYGFEEYKKWLEEDSILIVQIEHIDAINNLEDILTVEGVDGSIIGPYDLSGSLGVPGQFNDTRVIDAIQRYERVCDSLGKPKGFHVVPTEIELVNKYLNKGYSFLAIGLDTLYLGNKCRELLKR